MSFIGDGPPPKLGLDFGKEKEANIPVPINLEDARKAEQIQKHFKHIQAQQWFREFMLRYPDVQGPCSQFYRVIDGMADLGKVLHEEFGSVLKDVQERQRLKNLDNIKKE